MAFYFDEPIFQHGIELGEWTAMWDISFLLEVSELLRIYVSLDRLDDDALCLSELVGSTGFTALMPA